MARQVLISVRRMKKVGDISLGSTTKHAGLPRGELHIFIEIGGNESQEPTKKQQKC